MAVAVDNLKIIRAYAGFGFAKRLITKRPIERMARFDLASARCDLTSNEDGKPTALILGDFNERMAFYPSITEQILNAHSVANFINAVLETKKCSSEMSLVQPLQEVLLDFWFIGKVFGYYSYKDGIVAGNIQNLTEKRGDLEQLFEAYQRSIASGIPLLRQACLDVDHCVRKLNRYVIKDWAWMSQEVGDDGKVINDYYLPKEYWEPFAKHAAGAQAQAMAERVRK